MEQLQKLPRKMSWRSWLWRIITLSLGIFLLSLALSKINLKQALYLLQTSSPFYLLLAHLMYLPMILLAGYRLGSLCKSRFTTLEACKINLAGSSLNLILPSRLGDLARLGRIREVMGNTRAGFFLIVNEKGLDLLWLLLPCSISLFFFQDTTTLFQSLALLAVCITFCLLIWFSLPLWFRPSWLKKNLEIPLIQRANRLQPLTLLIWFFHWVQIHIFIMALGVQLPLNASLCLIPLSILSGLAPFTLAGIGARELAVLHLFHQFLSAEQAILTGFFCTSRYLIYATAGSFFLHKLWPKNSEDVGQKA